MLISTITRADGKSFELREGTDGSGRRIFAAWLLSEETITLHGERVRPWKHIERFHSRAEAENWIQWS